MTVKSHNKRAIALAQLETAIRLYLEGMDYYSAATLAGAADEILGQLLTHRGGVSALASLTRTAEAVQIALGGTPPHKNWFKLRANFVRNLLKHHDKDESLTASFDAEVEAAVLVDRAIANYFELHGRLTPAMQQFQDRRRAT